MATTKIALLEQKINEITSKALDVSNLKTDYAAYKLNDQEITKKINDKLELINSQILQLLNSQAQQKTQLDAILLDVAKIKSDTYV